MSFTKLFSWKKDSQKDRSREPVFKEIKRNPTRLVNYLPWDYYIKRYLDIDSETKLEMCIVIQKNGSIQQTYAFRGHDIESFSPDYIAAVFEYFNDQIKRLGDGWMVSVEAQRYRMHDYPSADFDSVAALLVDKEREAEFKGTGEHYDSCYFMNFVYKPETEIKKKALKFFFTEPVAETIIKDEIKYFLKTVENMTAVLSSRIIIRPLDCHETVCYLHSTCSTRKHEFNLPDHFMFLDTFIGPEKLDVGKTCRLGENYIPIVEIYDFPTRTYPAILNNLNKLNVEYRWVSRFFPLGKQQALKELEAYQQSAAAGKKSSKQLASEMALGYESTLQNHAGVQAQGEAEAAQEEVGGDINGMGYYQTSIMVWDTDYKAAISKMKQVQQLVEQCQFAVKEEEIGAFDAFLGMIAGNTTANIRRPLVTTGNFAHTLPFSAIWAGIENNKFMNEICGIDKPLVTCATNYGANFYLNLNDGDVGHTLIIGPTGAGKSTLLNLLAVSSLKYPGIQVFFMDYGLSSLTLTLSVGGTYINPADETVCFQPLRNIDDHNEFVWACNFIKTLIELQGIKIEAQMNVAIESAMDAVASFPENMRTLTHFRLNLEYVDSEGHRILDDALAPYCVEGRYGRIFDGDHTTLGNSRWVLFEMEHIMDMGPDCSGPAILFIFHFLEQSFTGRLTFFIMDECWFGLENPAISGKMKEYLLTLRKKNVFCIFATQNPSAIANSPMASTMIQNCPTQIFLADPRAKKLEEDYLKLGLSSDEVNILAMSTKKRDYYYKSTLGTRLFQLSLGEIELALFRGKETQFRAPDGSIMQWQTFLQFLLEDKKKNPDKAYVDKILDMQNIPFRHYLEGMNWESYL